jgi:hypothetical protein
MRNRLQLCLTEKYRQELSAGKQVWTASGPISDACQKPLYGIMGLHSYLFWGFLVLLETPGILSSSQTFEDIVIDGNVSTSFYQQVRDQIDI